MIAAWCLVYWFSTDLLIRSVVVESLATEIEGEFKLVSHGSSISWLSNRSQPAVTIGVYAGKTFVPQQVEVSAAAARRLRLAVGSFTGLWLMVAIALSVWVVFFMHQQMDRPLVNLQARLDEFQEHYIANAGETWQLRQTMEERRSDVVGDLARRFRQLFAELGQHESLLQEASEFASMGRFSGGLAHELGNPLAGILQAMYVAEPLPMGEEAGYWIDARTFEQINQALQRMDGIISGLQALFRDDPIDVGRVRISEILEAVETRFESRFVRFDPVDDPTLAVVAHRYLLEQALYNLVRNGVQAHQLAEINDPVSIHAYLETTENDDRLGSVIMEVVDHGQGIFLDESGEPRYNRRKGGMGLGLRIVAKAMRLMGGEVVYRTLPVDNNSDGGTIVRLRLPAADVTVPELSQQQEHVT